VIVWLIRTSFEQILAKGSNTRSNSRTCVDPNNAGVRYCNGIRGGTVPVR